MDSQGVLCLCRWHSGAEYICDEDKPPSYKLLHMHVVCLCNGPPWSSEFPSKLMAAPRCEARRPTQDVCSVCHLPHVSFHLPHEV